MGPRSSKRPSSNGGGNRYTPYSAITVDVRFPVPVIAVRVHHPEPVVEVTVYTFRYQLLQSVYTFRYHGRLCTVSGARFFFYGSDKNCRVSILFSLISQKLMKISISNFNPNKAGGATQPPIHFRNASLRRVTGAQKPGLGLK